jgi:hypothetical protein
MIAKSHFEYFFYKESEKEKLVKQFCLLCALEEKPWFNFVKKNHFVKTKFGGFSL